MNTEEFHKQLKQKREAAVCLAGLFESLLGFTPPERQFMIWLSRFDAQIVSDAIERTGEWVFLNEATIEKHPELAESLATDEARICSYASGCMYKMKEKAEAAA